MITRDQQHELVCRLMKNEEPSVYTQKCDWRPREEEKKERKIANHNEIYLICIGTRSSEAH
jgi:hypothetical protein